MSRVLLGWVLGLVAGIGLAAPALPMSPEPAPAAAADSSFAAAADSGSAPLAQDSWLSRLIRRHFGHNRQTGEDLGGQALETVDRYAAYAGRTIEVVLVHQVATFAKNGNRNSPAGPDLLDTLTDPLQTYTSDRVIRESLLFERGQVLDPFALADSERLLRNLPFISDVRILVVPLMGETGTVAVIVQTRDRWPIGADLKIKDRRQFTAGLYSVNVLGQGLGLRNDLIYHEGRRPQVGYRGRLDKANLAGSFVGVRLEFEDSWENLRRQVQVERNLLHPGIRLVGGGLLARTDNRDNEGLPRKYDQADLWVGWTLRGGPPNGQRGSARPHLIPALGVSHVFFAARPPVTAALNRSYHDRRLYLGSLTYQRLKDYKTSYLYRMGETEDVRSGLVLKGTAGYEHGEFQERTCAWAEGEVVSIRNRGDLAFVRLGGGGYFRNGRFEEGVLSCQVGLVSPARDTGRWRQRWYLWTDYTQGFDQPADQGISLGERSGIRDLEDERLLGFQRLVLNLESRLFAPWTWQGFRCMLLAYADAGAIADQEEPLLRQEVVASFGLGVRFFNPDLVFSPLELRLGLRRHLEGHGLLLGLAMGLVDPPSLIMPGVKPAPLAYE